MNTTEARHHDLGADQALGLERAEALLKGINLPARPAVLVQVLEEQRKPEGDVGRMADLISSDVALAASTLKVVNSPFFSLRRKIGSVHHAVRLLGIKNIANIVTGLMLRTAFSGSHARFLDAFWSRASEIALIAAYVAQQTDTVRPDEAYTLGLFSDCGAALLVRRFPNYEEVFNAAQQDETMTVTAYEDRELGTDHAVVGYMVAKSWQMPDPFCQALLRHHERADHYTTPDEALGDGAGLLAVLMVSEHLRRGLHGLPEAYEWPFVRTQVLAYLGLSEDRLEALQDGLPGVLDEAQAID